MSRNLSTRSIHSNLTWRTTKKKKSSSSGNVVTVADTLFKVLANKPQLKKNVSKQSRRFLLGSEKQ